MLEFFSDGEHNGDYRWGWSYAHGDAQDFVDRVYNGCVDHADNWCAPDLIACKTPIEEVKDGIHDCTLYDQAARVYVWTQRRLICAETKRALVCLREDKEANEWAQEKYDRKAVFV